MNKQGVGLALLLCTFVFCQPVAWRLNTLAGVFPGNDGSAINAILGRPQHLAYDLTGNLYIADTDNHQIRRLGRDGRIVAIAGTGVQGSLGDGGPALRAELNRPRGVAVDGNQLFIADSGNYRIRVMKLETGTIHGYAGEGVRGFAGDGGQAGNARFELISSITLDAQGNLLISDLGNIRVRRVNRQSGIISTFAGTGSLGSQIGPAATSTFLGPPQGLAVELASGAVYIADPGNRRVLRVDPSGTVRRFAGLAEGSYWPGSFDNSLLDGIPATEASLDEVTGLSIDHVRRLLYVSDYRGCSVRTVNLDSGIINTAVRCGVAPGLSAPFGVAVDPSGGVAISEIDAGRIRKLNALGVLETIAGGPPFGGDGPARNASLSQPNMAIPGGEGGYFVADSGNCVIRRISATGIMSAFAGQGCLAPGSRENNVEGIAVSMANFNHPAALAEDRRGYLYVSEGSNVNRIAVRDRTVVQVFRNLSSPGGIALDPAEEYLYVAETTGNRITRINLGTGARSIFAGAENGTSGFVGDGGSASEARFAQPTDVAVDRAGNLYVADRGNNRIRKIDKDTLRVSTVAGNGSANAVASGSATLSGLPSPSSIAVNADGALYTTSANRVLMIDVNGSMRVIAGSTQGGFAADGSLGMNARFNFPNMVRFDGTTLLLADVLNHRIRTLTPVPISSFALVSGNSQSAPVNASLPNPMVVQLRLADGTPVPGIAVAFAASAGRLDPATPVLTGVDGTASVRLTMPPGVGSVTVTATADGLVPVTFAATAFPALTVTPPRISSVITASAFGAAGRIAPGGWIELYGVDFTRETRQWSGGDFAGGVAPTSLGNVKVMISERPAFIQRISPDQINAVVPNGIGVGRVPVRVINADGNSESFMVEAAARAPALLAPPTFASGGAQYVVAILPDGAFAGPQNLIAGSAFRPARAGDSLVMYGVGFGATTPAIPAGQIATAATTLPNLRVAIGGVEARVDYAGLANGFVGLYQLNVVVPEGTASGPIPLAITVDGVALSQTLVVSLTQ